MTTSDDELTESDFAVLLAVADDAEPLAIVVNNVDENAREHAAIAIENVVHLCRSLEARGLIRLRWLENGRFRDPEVPLTESEYRRIPDLNPSGSPSSVRGLWVELTPAGKRLVLARLGNPSADALWRIEEFPAERRMVIYAATEELADKVARDRQAESNHVQLDGAVRFIERGIRFSLASGVEIRSGVRVTYRASSSNRKH